MYVDFERNGSMLSRWCIHMHSGKLLLVILFSLAVISTAILLTKSCWADMVVLTGLSCIATWRNRCRSASFGSKVTLRVGAELWAKQAKIEKLTFVLSPKALKEAWIDPMSDPILDTCLWRLHTKVSFLVGNKLLAVFMREWHSYAMPITKFMSISSTGVKES